MGQLQKENSTKYIKKELIPILFKLFQKTEEDGTLSNLFYEAIITMLQKPNKNNKHTHTHTRKSEASTSDKYRCKNPEHNISKSNSAIY